MVGEKEKEKDKEKEKLCIKVLQTVKDMITLDTDFGEKVTLAILPVVHKF